MGYRPPHGGEKGLQYGRVELRHRAGGDKRPQECPIFSQKEEETPVLAATVREAWVGVLVSFLGLTLCLLALLLQGTCDYSSNLIQPQHRLVW